MSGICSPWLILCQSYLRIYVLLLLLSHFSRVRLCATPETGAHQAPPSLGFSRREHWSGLPFPSPVHESEKSEVAQSCPTLSDPMDCSLPGSSVLGIFQARVLESGASDGGAWWAAIYGVAQSQTRLKRLSSSSSSMLFQIHSVLFSVHRVSV